MVLFTESLMESTSCSYLQFVDQELTTPTALTLVVKDIQGNVVDTRVYDVVKDLIDGGNFRYEFTLQNKEQLFFSLTATTGSQISYTIQETGYNHGQALESHTYYEYTRVTPIKDGEAEKAETANSKQYR